jgi:hypothetical protein
MQEKANTKFKICCGKLLFAIGPRSREVAHEQKVRRNMESSHSESAALAPIGEEAKRFPTWLKVGTVAAASALAGGLAAAWFYRGTLKRLRDSESHPENSNFGITSRHKDEDF